MKHNSFSDNHTQKMYNGGLGSFHGLITQRWNADNITDKNNQKCLSLLAQVHPEGSKLHQKKAGCSVSHRFKSLKLRLALNSILVATLAELFGGEKRAEISEMRKYVGKTSATRLPPSFGALASTRLGLCELTTAATGRGRSENGMLGNQAWTVKYHILSAAAVKATHTRCLAQSWNTPSEIQPGCFYSSSSCFYSTSKTVTGLLLAECPRGRNQEEELRRKEGNAGGEEGKRRGEAFSAQNPPNHPESSVVEQRTESAGRLHHHRSAVITAVIHLSKQHQSSVCSTLVFKQAESSATQARRPPLSPFLPPCCCDEENRHHVLLETGLSIIGADTANIYCK